MTSKSPISLGVRHQISTRSKTIPHQKNIRCKEDNNNTTDNKTTLREEAKTFASWYQAMVDNDRGTLSLYFADDVVLQWFGRTLRTRKKVASFLKYDTHCSRHNFTLVDTCNPITVRGEIIRNNAGISGNNNDPLAKPLGLIDTPATKLNHSLTQLSMRGSSLKKCHRPGLRSNSGSPEWEQMRDPMKHPLENADVTASEKKRFKFQDNCSDMEFDSDSGNVRSDKKRKTTPYIRRLNFDGNVQKTVLEHSGDNVSENKVVVQNTVAHSGDTFLESKQVISNTGVTTPINREMGQGDCLPSTSRTSSLVNFHQSSILPQLPRKYVEAKGFIEFTRMRSKRGANILKYERQCKVEFSYTDDPINNGEYIIWAIIYSDNNKCRRNLLAAFEEVARECEKAREVSIGTLDTSPQV